jgi:hypothetical protein
MDAHRKAMDGAMLALYRRYVEETGLGELHEALSFGPGPFRDWALLKCGDEGARTRTWAWLEFVYDCRMVLCLYDASRAMSWRRVLASVYEIGPLLFTSPGPLCLAC